MKRKYAVAAIATLFCFIAEAQKPDIVSVDKTNAAAGELVTLNGSGFGTNTNNVVVQFGAAKGTIKSIGNQLIEAIVPTGASFDNIAITRTDNGLTAYSPQRFFANYNGEHGLTATEFSAQSNFDAESGLYDLCACDFNNDGKVDVASSADGPSTRIAIFGNSSTPGSIDLTKNSLLLNVKSLHITCGDLNGDGLPDLVVTQSGDAENIFVLKNLGNLTFSNPARVFKMTGRKVKQVVIADLDLNGKPELIVTDKGSGNIGIFDNLSTTANVNFANPIYFDASSPTSDALEVVDLNNDRLPEIITGIFSATLNSDIYIYINNSSPGNFDFNDVKVVNSGQTISNLKAADLDGDGKPDLVATRLISNDLQIMRNTSSAGEPMFAEPLFIPVQEFPWGIGVGDLDGDGKVDLVISSISNDDKSLVILNNKSTAGSVSFETTLELPTTYITRNIRIADMDSDAKSDIVFASVDDNNAGITSSKISVIRNKACMVPHISPEGPLTICDGVEIPITATFGGTTYQWKDNGGVISETNDNKFTITTTGDFSVTAISESGACLRNSNTVVVDVIATGAGLNGTEPNASNNGAICVGNELELEVADVGATEYRWKGPEGFLQTGRQVQRSDFQMLHTGLYTVEMFAGDCVAQIDSTVVEGIDIPEFSVTYSGAEEFCDGLTKILNVSPPPASDFTMQWAEQTQGDLAGQTASSLTVSQSGTYRIKITPPHAGCTTVETGAVSFVEVLPPVADFDVEALICLGTQTGVTNLSTLDSRAEPVYQWTFGNENNDESTLATPVHTYASAGEKTIEFTIHYDGVAGCTSSMEETVTVVSPVLPTISDSIKSICPGDTIVLSISGDFASIDWNTGAQTDSIHVSSSGDYSVVTTDVNNCAGTDLLTITFLSPPNVVINADDSVIYLGESVDLLAGGASTYTWGPVAGLDVAEGGTVIAAPTETTTYTVIGTSEKSGCSAEASITIEVLGEKVGINPPVIFTPNNDGSNDTWVIPGVRNYPDCTLNIFDSKGRRVYEKTGYDDDWNGTHNGRELPDGVYYFVFGCIDKKSVTGTVTIVR